MTSQQVHASLAVSARLFTRWQETASQRERFSDAQCVVNDIVITGPCSVPPRPRTINKSPRATDRRMFVKSVPVFDTISLTSSGFVRDVQCLVAI